MAPTPQQLDQASVQKLMAAGAATQLYQITAFPQSGVSQLQNDDLSKYFEYGESMSIRRVRSSGSAQDYDPRSGTDADSAEPGYVIINVTLDRLFQKGYPVISSDANISTYIMDYLESNANDIGTSQDNYFYQKGFRDWTDLPSTGTVRLGAHPALQVVFSESATGVLNPFSDTQLLAADRVLFGNNVPQTGRYARLSASARQAFLGDGTLVSNFAGALAPQQPGSQILNGLASTLEVNRRDFMVCGSNAVTGQSAVASLGDGTATEPITAVVDDTTVFFEDDKTGSVPVGAVRITIGVTAALAGAAVGRIARLGPTGSPATAYGVILRVDAASKFVWLVPYDRNGNKLVAAQISTSTDLISIPAIPSVNPAYHREHLVYASRLLRAPSPDSGARMAIGRAPNSNMLIQVFSGSYQVRRFTESVATASLMGVKPSDYRKAVLMLTA
jgi:hypothetical protein